MLIDTIIEECRRIEEKDSMLLISLICVVHNAICSSVDNLFIDAVFREWNIKNKYDLSDVIRLFKEHEIEELKDDQMLSEWFWCSLYKIKSKTEVEIFNASLEKREKKQGTKKI